ncbi:MAG: hypothetical protein ACT4UP_08565 [Gammaproteobacteria bacterium]
MRRGAWIAACVMAWPAAGAEAPVEAPDPEFLEFLAEFDEEDDAFVDYMESRKGEKELKRAEAKATKDDDHE